MASQGLRSSVIRHSKSFRVIILSLGSGTRHMIFNLQGPSFSSRIPVRSPCRRSLWSRNCPGVAGGWDPASFRPSSLSPYLLLAFSPPLGLNRTSSSRRVPDSPSCLSLLLSPPFARRSPRLCLRHELLYGRGILKRVGPCAHNPPGLQPERIGPWEIDRLNTALPLSAFRVRGSERLLSTARCKNIPVKRAGECAWPSSQRQPGYQRSSFYPFAKETIARVHTEAIIFISMLIPIINRRRNSGVADNCL